MARSLSLVARDAALLRLMAMHPRDYATLYDEERVARGLKPLASRRQERIDALRAQLARLEGCETSPPVGH